MKKAAIMQILHALLCNHCNAFI